MQYSKSNIGRWVKTAPSGAAFPSFRVNVCAPAHGVLTYDKTLSFELASEKVAALIPFSIESMRTRTWTPRNPSLPNLTLSPADSGGKAMDSGIKLRWRTDGELSMMT